MPKNSELKYIIIDGKKLPFTCAEYVEILKIIRRNFMETVENLERDEEAKYLDEILKSIDQNNP